MAFAAGLHAQILYSVDVTLSGGANQTGSPTYTTDPTGLSTGTTSTNLARMTVTASAANNSFSSVGWNNTSTTANTSTNYIFFDLTAGTNALTVGNLQYAINGSNTAPNQGEWGFTLDGGNTFTLQPTFTVPFTLPSSLATWSFNAFTLASGNTVEFRFFDFGTTAINSANAASNAGSVRIGNISGNDLVLNAGAITGAPEPSTLAIMAGAAVLMGVIVYRRNRAV